MLRSLAWAWLICQLTGFVAAPVAVSFGAMQVAEDTGDHCCPGLAPGQACPMHHNRAEAKTCVMRSACSPSPAALVTLMGGLGLIPPASAVALTAFVAGDVALIPSTAAIARSKRPDSPPPRA
jgi:hypothetical protein